MSGPKLRCWVGCRAQVIGGHEPALIGLVFLITAACKVHEASWDTEPPAYVSWAPGRPASLADHTLLPLTPPPEAQSTDDTAPCEVEHGIAHA